jgi:hypothetical protein
MAQHRHHPSATRVLSSLVVSAALVIAVAAAAHRFSVARAVDGSPSAQSAPSSLAAATPTTSPPVAPSSTAPATPVTDTAAEDPDVAALARLVAANPAGSVSVAALDTATGVSTHAGAHSGMTTASVVKVQLLETLLLQHQRAGTKLSDDEADTARAMIENSDNAAAETIFWDVGGRSAVVAAEPQLGISTKVTVPGQDDYWGLTTTSATDQLTLLTNLVSGSSPLDAASRAYALELMGDVEDDQRWGVPAAADAGTSFAVKNGWLAVDDDGDLWAVNSLGVITADGDRVLVSVLTQHDESEQDGIELVQSLAKAAVAAVTG